MRALVLCALTVPLSLLACSSDDDPEPSCNSLDCVTTTGPGGSGGTAGAGGGGGAGGSAAGAGTTAFLEPCETDEQCTTGVCFAFNAKGKHCSKPCQDDAACEAPSPGCNGMGYCRLPQ